MDDFDIEKWVANKDLEKSDYENWIADRDVELKVCPKCGHIYWYPFGGSVGSAYRLCCACGFAWKSVGWHKRKRDVAEIWNSIAQNTKKEAYESEHMKDIAVLNN